MKNCRDGSHHLSFQSTFTTFTKINMAATLGPMTLKEGIYLLVKLQKKGPQIVTFVIQLKCCLLKTLSLNSNNI